MNSASTIGSSSDRAINILADISGSGNLSITDKTVTLSGDNTNYTGTMTIASGKTLQANSTNALTNTKLVVKAGAALKISGDQKVGTLTTTYHSAQNAALTVELPNSITVSDAYVQDALRIAGITVPLNAKLTSSSTRAPTVYYQNQAADETSSWDNVKIWSIGSKTGTVSTVVPTVGDTVHLTSTLRTSSSNDSAGKIHYFLPTAYVDSGSTIGLKNANATVYFPNLILNGGYLGNGKASGTTTKVDGHITVAADSLLQAQSDRSVNFLADISGDKKLTIGIDKSQQKATLCTAIFNGDNSGFTGSIYAQKYTWITANTPNELGKSIEFQGENQLTVNAAQSLDSMKLSGSVTLNGNSSLTVPAVSGSGFTLNQTGGTLYLTDAEPILNGNYNQTSGALQLDLNSTLTINGNLALSSLQVNSNDPTLFDPDEIYPILKGPNVSTLDWTGISVTGVGELASQSLGGMVQNGVFYIGTTGTIANHVPEPATWVLLLLGLGGFALRGRGWKHR